MGRRFPRIRFASYHLNDRKAAFSVSDMASQFPSLKERQKIGRLELLGAEQEHIDAAVELASAEILRKTYTSH